ncbi:PREDICTED: uncharacterized protein LOC109175303 isoform X2 [Ipomoea nil]|uniref:uncharacterized protein LOC109175303 isoform X2 n=1 Tax=Ipomoea nil TaxID=35883 RepID=UPI000901F866|nr:PREDICTED: uncharacterized protein LOC109175303 isoform X2 [Ipomoea nil]
MKMGCFLACFGYAKKRKRRKPGSCKVQSTDQVAAGSYVPLDFEKLDASDSNTSARRKEEANVKMKKKKVRFNLNVKTYEPLEYEEIEDYLSEGEEKTKWEYSKEEATKAMRSYPSNYRYYNCVDEEEEEGEMELDESDLEFDEIEDFDEEDCHVPVKTGNRDSLSGGGRYVSSVLNPVENVVQWKAIKARERVELKNEKENMRISDPLGLNTTINLKHCQTQIPVDASLSNWLISSSETKMLPRLPPLQTWASC